MMMGLVIPGMLAGAAAALAVLVHGLPLWLALPAYCGAGSLTLLLAALAATALPHRLAPGQPVRPAKA